MDWVTRAAASLAVTVALAMPAGTITWNTSAPRAASGDTNADTCSFSVSAEKANVRSAPDRTARVIKQQAQGDRVAGPCHTVFNDGRRWAEVHLDGGETAWMARSLLKYENRS